MNAGVVVRWWAKAWLTPLRVDHEQAIFRFHRLQRTCVPGKYERPEAWPLAGPSLFRAPTRLADGFGSKVPYLRNAGFTPTRVVPPFPRVGIRPYSFWLGCDH